MKNGDTVRVRRCVAASIPMPVRPNWVTARVDLISTNGESLAVSAQEGLSTEHGVGFDSETGRQQMLLLKGDRFYQCLASLTWWEVEECPDIAN